MPNGDIFIIEALLAMIANLAVQSSARTFFTALFYSLTTPTMLIRTPYFEIITSTCNETTFCQLAHLIYQKFQKFHKAVLKKFGMKRNVRYHLCEKPSGFLVISWLT